MLSRFVMTTFFLGLGTFLLPWHLPDAYSMPKQCRKIRFSDVGWTDISASTALASEILKDMGYDVRIRNVSVPVTYMGMKNKDIDVFLGNWMPSMAADIRDYEASGTVETVGVLLEEARYTLAVPRYVADAGVRTFSDLAKNSRRFARKIYAVEPGNDGNRLIQKMLQDPDLGLKGWRMIESSEQAMLMEVQRSVRNQHWVVFLGWEPHPMNQKIDMVYLEGGDQFFGPNQGKAVVRINTRANYSKHCPEVGKFLKGFQLSLKVEQDLMTMILDEKLTPAQAARKWMSQNQSEVKNWMKKARNSNVKRATHLGKERQEKQSG